MTDQKQNKKTENNNKEIDINDYEDLALKHLIEELRP